ncbi:MAG: hypothetical protein SNJ72_00650 [Fimbriimonadales bacterium]
MVRRVCRWTRWLRSRYGVRWEDAEDIVQEVRVCLLVRYLSEAPDAEEQALAEHIDSVPEPLFKCMLHARLVDFLRRARREADAYEAFMSAMSVERMEADWMEPLLEAQVVAAFPENAQMIAQRVSEGYSWSEIAQQMGLSQSAVKMRFWRGVAHVRQIWGITCDDSTDSDDNYGDRLQETVRPKEVYDAQATDCSDGNSICACGSECCDDAQHSRSTLRDGRGGGGGEGNACDSQP